MTTAELLMLILFVLVALTWAVLILMYYWVKDLQQVLEITYQELKNPHVSHEEVRKMLDEALDK